MEKFDYILSGGGCAGLSLAFHLVNSRLKESKILIIDPVLDQIPNKTWCYWHTDPLAIHPEINLHFWDSLLLDGENKSLTKNLQGLKYFHLNSHDFFNSVRKILSNYPAITFLKDQVIEMAENRDEILVQTKESGVFSCNFVFDSRLNTDEKYEKKLKQVFLGWKVRCAEEVFHPESFTMMDFKTHTGNPFDFFYILPFNKNEALVEYTIYTSSGIDINDLEKALTNYLSKKLKNKTYEITFQESGVIPMSTQVNPSRKGKRIIPIGTNAAWTKPSTGYTFHQIQINCDKLVKKLENEDFKNLGFKRKSRFVFYDTILLNIAHKWPDKLQDVFLNLFSTSSPDLVLRFLSEQTGFFEEFRMLSRLKFGIFIKSLFHYESH
jgi:lycopene beta-cyclase